VADPVLGSHAAESLEHQGKGRASRRRLALSASRRRRTKASVVSFPRRRRIYVAMWTAASDSPRLASVEPLQSSALEASGRAAARSRLASSPAGRVGSRRRPWSRRRGHLCAKAERVHNDLAPPGPSAIGCGRTDLSSSATARRWSYLSPPTAASRNGSAREIQLFSPFRRHAGSSAPRRSERARARRWDRLGFRHRRGAVTLPTRHPSGVARRWVRAQKEEPVSTRLRLPRPTGS
jgi:hypothetical protein